MVLNNLSCNSHLHQAIRILTTIKKVKKTDRLDRAIEYIRLAQIALELAEETREE